MGKRHRAVTCLSVLVFMFCLSSLRAQEVDTTYNNSLRAGSWALQFGITSNFNLRSFLGTVISVKYHLSPDAAVRIGMGGLLNSTDGDRTETNFLGDSTTSIETGTQTYEDERIEFNIQYVRYTDPVPEVKVYFGVGIAANYYRTRQDASERITYPVPSAGGRTSHVTDETIFLGPSGVLGAEWFAVRWLSLHAEYGFSVQYGWGERKESNTSDVGIPTRYQEKTSETMWRFEANGVRFGISVYI